MAVLGPHDTTPLEVSPSHRNVRCESRHVDVILHNGLEIVNNIADTSHRIRQVVDLAYCSLQAGKQARTQL